MKRFIYGVITVAMVALFIYYASTSSRGQQLPPPGGGSSAWMVRWTNPGPIIVKSGETCVWFNQYQPAMYPGGQAYNWIGFFRASDPDTAQPLWYMYTEGSLNSVHAPLITASPGRYNLRMFTYLTNERKSISDDIQVY